MNINAPCAFCSKKSSRPRLETLSKTTALGHQQTLLFVHGGWHSASCWQDYMNYFAELGYDCHAVSLSGHGASEGHEQINSFSLDDFCADICQVASSLPKPPILIAHSFGGLIALRYLTKHTPRGVVLLAPIPPEGPFKLSLRIFRRHPLQVIKLFLKNDATLVMNSPALAKEFLFSNDIPDNTLEAHFSQLGSESMKAYLESFVKHPLCPVNFNGLAFVIGAKNDRLISTNENRSTASFLSAQFFEIDHIAHNLMNDVRWLDSAKKVEECLKKISP